MYKLNELSTFLGDKIEEMNTIYPFMSKDATYKVSYIDNQNRQHDVDIQASCFTNMMSEVEKEANEQGHGLKALNVSREGSE